MWCHPSKGHVFEALGTDILRGSWCHECAQTPYLCRGASLLLDECTRRKGVCLTPYKGGSTPHRFRCEAGHEWISQVGTVIRGGWCRECLGEQKKPALNLEAARQHARYYGGECLSTEFVEAPGKLHWSCGFGHTWYASLRNLKRNQSWCVKCAKLADPSMDKLERTVAG